MYMMYMHMSWETRTVTAFILHILIHCTTQLHNKIFLLCCQSIQKMTYVKQAYTVQYIFPFSTMYFVIAGLCQVHCAHPQHTFSTSLTGNVCVCLYVYFKSFTLHSFLGIYFDVGYVILNSCYLNILHM